MNTPNETRHNYEKKNIKNATINENEEIPKIDYRLTSLK
jgi:hypothetical protein